MWLVIWKKSVSTEAYQQLVMCPQIIHKRKLENLIQEWEEIHTVVPDMDT